MGSYSITAIGMGTVFLALIALSLILTLFPLVFKKTGKRVKEMAPLPVVSSTAAPAPRAAPAAAVSDLELVTVITAAVAAASGMAVGGFRVAEIHAASAGGFSTPAWGHVDRLTRTPFAAR